MDQLDIESLVVSTLWLTGNWAAWIHRRVESLDLLDERRLRRRVSVDLVIPQQAVCVESVPPLYSYAIPLGLFRKGVLRRFDVTDESGRSLPLMSRAQTAEIGARLLISVAIVALEAAKCGPLKPEVANELRRVAMSFHEWDGQELVDTFDDSAFELMEAWRGVIGEVFRSTQGISLREAISGDLSSPALKRRVAEVAGIESARIDAGVSDTDVLIAAARRKSIDEHVIQRGVLAMDLNTGPLMIDLASSYLLFVQLPGAPGTRRILKYAYEHEAGSGVLRRIWSVLITGLAGFGVHRVEVPMPNLASSGSFHVEVNSHEELFISRASLNIALADQGASTTPAEGSTGEQTPPSQQSVLRDGPGPFVHLYVGGAPPGSDAKLKLEFCLDPSGLLPAGFFICALVFVLLFSGLRFHDLGISRTGDTAAALVIAAAGVFAGYLFRPGEHRFVRRFLRELRLDTALLTGFAFGAAGLLAVAWPERVDAWTLLTVGAFILLLRRTVALVVAEAVRRNVLPVQWLASFSLFITVSVVRVIQARGLWSDWVGLVVVNVVAALALQGAAGRLGLGWPISHGVGGAVYVALAAGWSAAVGGALTLTRRLTQDPDVTGRGLIWVSAIVAGVSTGVAYFEGHRPLSEVEGYVAAVLIALTASLVLLAISKYAGRQNALAIQSVPPKS